MNKITGDEGLSSPLALQREAKIIARLLVTQHGWLSKRKTGIDENGWFLVNKSSNRKSAGSKVAIEIVVLMQQKDWLKKDPTGVWRLSSIGLAALVPSSQSDDFAGQHQLRRIRTIKDSAGVTKSVLSNEAENPLGWMRARKDKDGNPLINDAQFEAGERLRRDFTIGQMSARITSNWDFSGGVSSGNSRNGCAGIEISDRALAAREQLLKALDFLGREMASIVFDVCCMASGLEVAERRLGWPRRSGKLVLQIALTKLSTHYGIAQSAKIPAGSAVIRQWGQQGYRPQIPSANHE